MARLLLDTVIGWAKTRGVHMIRLGVTPRHPAALWRIGIGGRRRSQRCSACWRRRSGLPRRPSRRTCARPSRPSRPACESRRRNTRTSPCPKSGGDSWREARMTGTRAGSGHHLEASGGHDPSDQRDTQPSRACT
ncbi:MAG: hypothetical protein ACYC4J_04895 [Gemmatimonadaceae bacterium]